MSSHIVRGMSSLNTKKHKSIKPNAKLLAAKAEHEKWLSKRVGVKKKTYQCDFPKYSTDKNLAPLSDVIPGACPAKRQEKYTGNEIMGIATMHKSNSVPVRKDSNAAVDIARMRR